MKRLNLALIMALNSFICFADAPPPPDLPPNEEINSVPIDSNLYILLIVGIVYTLYKMGYLKNIQIILYKNLVSNNIIYYFCNRKP